MKGPPISSRDSLSQTHVGVEDPQSSPRRVRHRQGKKRKIPGGCDGRWVGVSFSRYNAAPQDTSPKRMHAWMGGDGMRPYMRTTHSLPHGLELCHLDVCVCGYQRIAPPGISISCTRLLATPPKQTLHTQKPFLPLSRAPRSAIIGHTISISISWPVVVTVWCVCCVVSCVVSCVSYLTGCPGYPVRSRPAVRHHTDAYDWQPLGCKQQHSPVSGAKKAHVS